ncbi:sulfotransferase family protein [Coleofasciculus sp. E2-BRE-01]|uniref:sulfotransferase family protein n=1 Tax=Coleofasciculus sp. E2-BRE-01 TaxID=3069524 RepID=UPI004062F488
MRLPNFLVIGAAKAGTTSLYYYLKQHPQIFMTTRKEPRFFALKDIQLDFRGPAQGINKTSVTNYNEYCNLFNEVTNEIAIGEASTIYLYDPRAPKLIKHYIPDVKLIAILRDPIERAYSSFSHLTRDGYETLTFLQALREEKARILDNWPHLWHYRESGFYYEQLKRYFEIFSKQQLKIYLYEDLKSNSIAVVQDIFIFLGVDDSFIPDLTKQNESGKPKSRLLIYLFKRNNFLKSLLKPFFFQAWRNYIRSKALKLNLEPMPHLPLEVRQELVEIYRKDILKVQDLIQRDLSKWIE